MWRAAGARISIRSARDRSAVVVAVAVGAFVPEEGEKLAAGARALVHPPVGRGHRTGIVEIGHAQPVDVVVGEYVAGLGRIDAVDGGAVEPEDLPADLIGHGRVA